VFSCLQRHPGSRPTAGDALNDPFFAQCMEVRGSDIRAMLDPIVPVTPESVTGRELVTLPTSKKFCSGSEFLND